MNAQTVTFCFLFWMLGGTQLWAAGTLDPASKSTEGQVAKQPSRIMVEQKLQLVKMMLSSSPTMQRASGSDDEQLKRQVAEVLARYAMANDALNAGETAHAEKLADEVLSLLEDISRQAPDSRQAEATQRKRYEELSKDLRSAEATYQDLRRRMGATSKVPASIERAGKQNEQAQALARDGHYREAGDLLKDAHAEIVSALNKLLGSTALTHDLKFNSAAEEYEYELARYHSYEELAPIAYVELKPDDFTMKLSERYVQESRVLRDAAKQQAAQGEHKEAIKTLLEAIKRMLTALRVLGLVLQE